MTHTNNPNNPNQPIALVAYHANCIDGFTAAWVTHKALVEQGATVDLLAVSYNEASTQDLLDSLEEAERAGYPYGALFIVDFSLDTVVLATITELHPKLVTTVLDHHKTAFEKYAPEITVVSDSCFIDTVQGANIVLMNAYSGAHICQHYFYPGCKVPALVTYVQDYDLWQFKLGDETKHVNKFLVQGEKTIEQWTHIAKTMDTEIGLRSVLEAGKVLQEIHDKKVAEVAEKAVPVTIRGQAGLAVVCPYELTSDVGHVLATKCGTFGAMLSLDMERTVIKWSLRSNGDFDVSAIAKTFGGGGHKNAGGFETSLLGDT